MAEYRAEVSSTRINLSPVGFRLCAADFYKCRQAFPISEFSLVPYFLLCRAIELHLKSIHLETKNIEEVKRQFSHDLVRLYDRLPPACKTLCERERSVLAASNAIYKTDVKGFEYFRVSDAVRGFSSFPAMSDLDALTATILAIEPPPPEHA